MAFEWVDFLTLARFLQSQIGPELPVSQEAVYRCAIGRAYYAAFGHAFEYASQWLGFRGKRKAEEKSQDHGALKAFFKSKRRRMLAERLESLRDWRNLCDYEKDGVEVKRQELLQGCIDTAASIFTELVPPRK